MNTAKLNYQDFVQELRKTLLYFIPRDVQLDIHPVLKNNSLHLDGLVLRQDGQNMTPNFYLQDYYNQYSIGRTVDELAQDILHQWKEMEGISCRKLPDMTFANCRNYIVYRLVNAKRNQELLEEIPHIPFLDLAVTFYYLVEQNADGISSIRISNSLIEQWGVNIQTLMELASQNTPRLFPYQFHPLQQFLQTVFGVGKAYDMASQETIEVPIHLLTNTMGINGAAVWLYPDLLSKIAKVLGSNFYILPSSIHELLLLREEESITEEGLLEMVAHVNRACVLPAEILSDNIYLYDKEKNAVCIIEQTSDNV